MFAKTCVVGVALPVVLSFTTMLAPTAAANPVNWDAVAQCESGGNWAINTGNGYSGGLQWLPQTWASVRAPGDPVNAHDATREQQIAAANRLYARAGLRPWPVCGDRG